MGHAYVPFPLSSHHCSLAWDRMKRSRAYINIPNPRAPIGRGRLTEGRFWPINLSGHLGARASAACRRRCRLLSTTCACMHACAGRRTRSTAPSGGHRRKAKERRPVGRLQLRDSDREAKNISWYIQWRTHPTHLHVTYWRLGGDARRPGNGQMGGGERT